jgi:2-amino-4-hydroxy-6-hydroxymethyldihydropteridine diphosphokinase
LDLNLLVYDALVLDHPRLQLPHPEMHRRNFVLYPLADIAPDLVLPSGISVDALLKGTPRDGLEPLIP